MDTSVKKRYSQEEKTVYISRWQASDQSKMSFAKEAGLNYDTFLCWIRKEGYIHPPVPIIPSPSFVSVQVEHSIPTPKSGIPIIEINLANGSHISFYQTVPIDYLRDCKHTMKYVFHT